MTVSLPARGAGDYYDFIPLHSVSGTLPLEMAPRQAQKFGLVIADVADKGTPAALFMVNIRATLRASMFVTRFYAQINNLDGVVTYFNVGHNPPLLTRGRGGKPELLTRTSVHREKSAAGLVEVIETALKAHIGETAPFDDITLMALKRL